MYDILLLRLELKSIIYILRLAHYRFRIAPFLLQSTFFFLGHVYDTDRSIDLLISPLNGCHFALINNLMGELYIPDTDSDMSLFYFLFYFFFFLYLFPFDFFRKKKKDKEKTKLKELVASTLKDEIDEVKSSRSTRTKAELAFERSKRKKVMCNLILFSFGLYGYCVIGIGIIFSISILHYVEVKGLSFI